MPVVGIRELKIHASAILRRVRDEGEEYVITFHGRPVGMLIPIDGSRVEEGTVSVARAMAQANISEEVLAEVAEERSQRRRARAEEKAAPRQEKTTKAAVPKAEEGKERPVRETKPARPRRAGRGRWSLRR